MKALVYHGPGEKDWEEVPDPSVLADTDAIVRIDSTTICGTDLHILKGDVATTEPGRVLGHEAVGTIVEAGRDVRSVSTGDRVLLSCISACGRCRFCRAATYGQCLHEEGGWVLGHTVDGVQADFARVPFADNSVHPVPEDMTDEQVIYLSDILATGYEVGVLAGRVEPGDVVAVVGCGPVGLSAMLTARLLSPAHIVAIDLAEARRRIAAGYADTTASPDEAADHIADLTGSLGVDVAIEAVGVPASFELCCELIRPGGRVANIGVHGQPVTLHLERLWGENVTITSGKPDTRTIPTLLQAIRSGVLDATAFTSHRFPLNDTLAAYDLFGDSAKSGALKVVLGGQQDTQRTVDRDRR